MRDNLEDLTKGLLRWLPSYVGKYGCGKSKCKETSSLVEFAKKDVRCIEALPLDGNPNRFMTFVVMPEDSYYYYRFDVYGGRNVIYSSKEKISKSIEKTLRAYYAAEGK